MAKSKNADIAAIIKEAVKAGIEAGRIQAKTIAANAYKETEKRLFAYPVLLDKIADDKEKLQELLTYGAPERSTSIVRFNKSGVRLSPDEMYEGLIQDKTATIAADQHEADTIAGALSKIKHDPYYAVITGKYIDGQTDDDIAASIPCDPSTVRRNRGRLVRRLAVWLYGANAL